MHHRNNQFTRSDSVADPRISVLFPVLGRYDMRRLFLAVESVRLQTYPNIEIVISEQNAKPTYERVARRQGARYVFIKAAPGEHSYNLGLVRNAGIRHATGTYLYLNDADIVFLRKNYLKNLYRLILERQVTYLDFPPMKRLVRSHFRAFYERVRRTNLKRQIQRLSFPDGYTTENDESNPLRKFRYGTRNKICTISEKEYQAIKGRNIDAYWFALLHFTRHPGTIFAERESVLAAGGYCEEFRGWGCEDIDLKDALFALMRNKSRHDVLIPRKKKFDVLHLDHQKRFSEELYIQNKRLYDARKGIRRTNSLQFAGEMLLV